MLSNGWIYYRKFIFNHDFFYDWWIAIACFGYFIRDERTWSYLYALTILIASVVELIKFISYIIGGANYELSIKDIPKMVKSIFKKDQKEKKN